jgi:hypothetical protein
MTLYNLRNDIKINKNKIMQNFENIIAGLIAFTGLIKTSGKIETTSTADDCGKFAGGIEVIGYIKTKGIKEAVTAGSAITVGSVCFLASDGKWDKVDGILDGTDVGFSKRLGICLISANDTQASEMLLMGSITSASFPTLTVGAPVYLADTAGTVVVAQPSTTNFAIRVLGFATATDTLYFNPSNDYIVKA